MKNTTNNTKINFNAFCEKKGYCFPQAVAEINAENAKELFNILNDYIDYINGGYVYYDENGSHWQEYKFEDDEDEEE